jgi:hypothetical protein
MIVPQEILTAWEKLRSVQDVAILQKKLANQGYEYTTESCRQWLKGDSMPDFAYDIFVDFYAEKAIKVAEDIAKFKKLMKPIQ